MYGPPRPPWIAKNAHFVYIVTHIWKKWWLFFPLLIIRMSDLWWGLTTLKFLFTWVRRKGPHGPQDPPIWKQKLSSYCGFKFKMSYQMASLFDMYIDMCERIAGRQDRPSLIIEPPLRAPKYIIFTIWPINEKLVFKLIPLVVHTLVTKRKVYFGTLPLIAFIRLQTLTDSQNMPVFVFNKCRIDARICPCRLYFWL